MQFYLASRRIVSIRIVDKLASDATVEPIGTQFVHGFNIVLTKQSHTRLRFTLSHELCHTFFYEFVPEIKFLPHAVDPAEERLCDFGAAELLMPATSVQRMACSSPVCMQSLCNLASEFSVSVAAMFVRLRSLRLWNCVFSEWHRMLNGTFVLANFYGGKRMPWEWEDPSILNRAWESYESSIGNTVVRYRSEEGGRYYSTARFDVRRLGNRIFSLWGSDLEAPSRPRSLFDVAPAHQEIYPFGQS
jgi:hypothetical protein